MYQWTIDIRTLIVNSSDPIVLDINQVGGTNQAPNQPVLPNVVEVADRDAWVY